MNLGKPTEETEGIDVKLPVNPNLMQLPKYNLANIKSEYEIRNTIFKNRRSINNKKKPKIGLIKSNSGNYNKLLSEKLKESKNKFNLP